MGIAIVTRSNKEVFEIRCKKCHQHKRFVFSLHWMNNQERGQ